MKLFDYTNKGGTGGYVIASDEAEARDYLVNKKKYARKLENISLSEIIPGTYYYDEEYTAILQEQTEPGIMYFAMDYERAGQTLNDLLNGVEPAEPKREILVSH